MTYSLFSVSAFSKALWEPHRKIRSARFRFCLSDAQKIRPPRFLFLLTQPLSTTCSSMPASPSHTAPRTCGSFPRHFVIAAASSRLFSVPCYLFQFVHQLIERDPLLVGGRHILEWTSFFCASSSSPITAVYRGVNPVGVFELSLDISGQGRRSSARTPCLPQLVPQLLRVGLRLIAHVPRRRVPCVSGLRQISTPVASMARSRRSMPRPNPTPGVLAVRPAPPPG